MNITPEFRKGYQEWKDCDVYNNGKYLGKANIEIELVFDLSSFEEFFENLMDNPNEP